MYKLKFEACVKQANSPTGVLVTCATFLCGEEDYEAYAYASIHRARWFKFEKRVDRSMDWPVSTQSNTWIPVKEVAQSRVFKWDHLMLASTKLCAIIFHFHGVAEEYIISSLLET